jgi:hypothetical protein
MDTVISAFWVAEFLPFALDSGDQALPPGHPTDADTRANHTVPYGTAPFG